MRLILLRHAKSSWDHPGLRDHDRPLDSRGQRAAPAMGRHLSETDLRIDRVLTSTAARAMGTALAFVDAFDPRVPVVETRDLYHADPLDMLEIARDAGLGGDVRIMLVGHNPGMHDLALDLCGEGEPRSVRRLEGKFPTGALAEFDLPDGDPTELGDGAGRLVRFVRPKDLPDAKKLRL